MASLPELGIRLFFLALNAIISLYISPHLVSKQVSHFSDGISFVGHKINSYLGKF